ncbi:hypothetical protein BDW69DRAFT_186905 [Aspergillus filifer]
MQMKRKASRERYPAISIYLQLQRSRAGQEHPLASQENNVRSDFSSILQPANMKFSTIALSIAAMVSSAVAVELEIRNIADGAAWTHATVPLGSDCTKLPIPANQIALNVTSERGLVFACVFFASSDDSCVGPVGETATDRPYLPLATLAQSAFCYAL